MAKKNYTHQVLGLVDNGNDHLLSNIALLAARLLRADVSLVSVMQAEFSRQYVSAAFGMDIETPEKRLIDYRDSICKIVFAEEQMIAIENVKEDPRTMDLETVRSSEFGAYLGTPIHGVTGKVIGVLCCIRKRPGPWDPIDLDSIERLGVEVDDIVVSRAHAVELETTNARIRRLLAARSSFTSHLSHEIRTPLTGLVASVRLLHGMDLDGKASDLVQVLNRSAVRLLSIMNDTLDFAKLDSGQFKLDLEEIVMGDIGSEIVSTFLNIAEEKQILVKLDNKIGEKKYFGDRRAIYSIIQNLFSNAVKFTNQGYAELALSEDAYGCVVIQVTDTGIGIANDALDTIFEEFQQANPRIARKYGGTGLGMAIVKGLVNVMHGEISAESAPGKGTSFTVRLPLEPVKPVIDAMHDMPTHST